MSEHEVDYCKTKSKDTIGDKISYIFCMPTFYFCKTTCLMCFPCVNKDTLLDMCLEGEYINTENSKTHIDLNKSNTLIKQLRVKETEGEETCDCNFVCCYKVHNKPEEQIYGSRNFMDKLSKYRWEMISIGFF